MAYIKAISYYLPERAVSNEELVREFPEWSVEKVAQKVGVNTRHIAADNETAGDRDPADPAHSVHDLDRSARGRSQDIQSGIEQKYI